jgi:hypothetical protein
MMSLAGCFEPARKNGGVLRGDGHGREVVLRL